MVLASTMKWFCSPNCMKLSNDLFKSYLIPIYLNLPIKIDDKMKKNPIFIAFRKYDSKMYVSSFV